MRWRLIISACNMQGAGSATPYRLLGRGFMVQLVWATYSLLPHESRAPDPS